MRRVARSPLANDHYQVPNTHGARALIRALMGLRPIRNLDHSVRVGHEGALCLADGGGWPGRTRVRGRRHSRAQ